MNETLKSTIIDCLINIKKELNKRNKLSTYGIDLANYENLYFESLINLLSELLYDETDLLEWWIFEDVEKIIYYDDNSKRNIEDPKDFINYILELYDKNI